MKRDKMKVALVLVFFALVVAASLVFPALGLDWQDRRIGNQVQFETTDEVALRREDIFSLEEKIRLFSGYNSNAQIAVINWNDMEDELEEVMNQAVLEEYKKLCDLGLLEGDMNAVSLNDIEYIDRVKYFVFDQKNPSKSMIIWTYLLPVEGNLGCVVLNLEQESKKILGFSRWSWYSGPSFDTEITEDMISAFAGYLGYVEHETRLVGGSSAKERYAEYPYPKTEAEAEAWEKEMIVIMEAENAASEYGVDVWGNPWREIYQIVMGAKGNEEESDSVVDYRITASEGGIVFGKDTMFY